MNDRYSSFLDLARHEREGEHYQVQHKKRKGSLLALVAPHGGTIEPGTSEITLSLAGNCFSWYLFESKRAYDQNYISLHITSHLLDEPRCMELISGHPWVVTIHGCNEAKDVVYLGGLERRLISSVGCSLNNYGIPTVDASHRFPGRHRNNVCNRGDFGKGLQIEVSGPLREPDNQGPLVLALRSGLDSFLCNLTAP